MSHVSYDIQLADAMNALQEQVKLEHLPKQLNADGKPNIEDWSAAPGADVFHYLASLYLKYVDIARKLEECYDQIVQPQKRQFIKKTLEGTLSRITDIKKDLVALNSRPGSVYVHLDQFLFDLKLDPSAAELPVPRYFAEDDRLPVNIKFEEPMTKPKKKLKSKKPKAKVEEKQPDKFWLDQKLDLVNKMMLDTHDHADPEQEVKEEASKIKNLGINFALRMFQMNERGRQGRKRVEDIDQTVKKNIREEKEQQAGRIVKKDSENMRGEAIIHLQSRMQAILARKRVERLRDKEMEFLGIKRPASGGSSTDASSCNDPVAQEKAQEKARKLTQQSHQQAYLDVKQDVKDEVRETDGANIMSDMLQDRREWINQYRRLNRGKVPGIKEFEERHNVVEAPEADEETDGGEKKSSKGDKKASKGDKKKTGKKKVKKSKEDEGIVKIGPTETVRKFDEFAVEYNDTWVNRDETDNYRQQHDVSLVREEVKPELQKEFTSQIDEMIKIELENLKLMQGKDKKAKKKKTKKVKKRKEKPLKLPGVKYLKGKEPEEILLDLVAQGIVKKLPPQQMNDFIGEYNPIASLLDDVTKTPHDPSMALIRDLATEYIVYPLGSEVVRSRMRDKVNSVLFYGPSGAGKTQMVRTVVTHTNSMLFDLSAHNLEGKVCNKEDAAKLVASVFLTAKQYQPAVIYIDDAEKIWPAKKKKKGKGRRGLSKGKLGGASDPTRIKKPFLKWAKSGSKFLDRDQRITIIGCSNQPEEASRTDFRKVFEKQLYFPCPDYATRRLMWKTFIEQFGGKMKTDFPLSTLAEISNGYTAGSIKSTCEKLLTEHRVRSMELRPLNVAEFIDPLGNCENLMQDKYEDLQKYTDFATGDGKRRQAMQKIIDGVEDKPKKKKAKK